MADGLGVGREVIREEAEQKSCVMRQLKKNSHTSVLCSKQQAVTRVTLISVIFNCESVGISAVP